MKKPYPSKATRAILGLTPAEFATLRRLNSPEKIQDFILSIPSNFEIGGATYLSVREVLRQRRCHCIEGAQVAAAALWIHGEPPLLWNLSSHRDDDHVVALFRRNGLWGGISKSNGIPLRYRAPLHRDLRELAMSYHHEYANRRGQLSLARFSSPLDLRAVDPALWVTNPRKCNEIVFMLDELPHERIVTDKALRGLKTLDRFEKKVRAIRQHPRPVGHLPPG